MDAVAAIARTSISLVAVLGLLYLISRWLKRRQIGAVGASEFVVLSKQSLGAKAAVALVKVGDKALVVGVSDAGVNLLGETTVAEVFKDSPESVEEVDITAQEGAEQLAGTEAVAVDGQTEPQVGERYVRKAGETIAVKPRHSHPQQGVAGSALSPATWSKAVDVLRERTTRR
jgi:flagellar protein FliO/FliZ